jgi:hypothetical protein
LNGADDRVRTGDLNLGKVALYQLSYVRSGSNCIGSSADHEPRFVSAAGTTANADCDLLGQRAIGDLVDDKVPSIAGEDERGVALVLPPLHHEARFEPDRQHVGFPLARVDDDQPLICERDGSRRATESALRGNRDLFTRLERTGEDHERGMTRLPGTSGEPRDCRAQPGRVGESRATGRVGHRLRGRRGRYRSGIGRRTGWRRRSVRRMEDRVSVERCRL